MKSSKTWGPIPPQNLPLIFAKDHEQTLLAKMCATYVNLKKFPILKIISHELNKWKNLSNHAKWIIFS